MWFILMSWFMFVKQLHPEALGTEKINAFMRGIYSHDAFIPGEEALTLSGFLHAFVSAYLHGAYAAFVAGVQAYPLFPKLHALHEVAHKMCRQAKACGHAMNPAMMSCSVDEDFIGRFAAVSRCVSPKLIARRAIERYLAHIQIAWARA
jgi:hypothetical protein